MFTDLAPEYVVDVVVGNENSAIIAAFKTSPCKSSDREAKPALNNKSAYIINTWLIHEDRYFLINNILIDKNTLKEQGLFMCGYKEISYNNNTVLSVESYSSIPEVEEMSGTIVLKSHQNGLSNRGGANVSKFEDYDDRNLTFKSEMMFSVKCNHYFSKHAVNQLTRCPYCAETTVRKFLNVAWFQPKTLNVLYEDTYKIGDNICTGLEAITL